MDPVELISDVFDKFHWIRMRQIDNEIRTNQLNGHETESEREGSAESAIR